MSSAGQEAFFVESKTRDASSLIWNTEPRVLTTCSIQGAQHMICMKKARFLS